MSDIFNRLSKLFGEGAARNMLTSAPSEEDDVIQDFAPGNTDFLTPEQIQDAADFKAAKQRDENAKDTADYARALQKQPQSNSFLTPEQRSLIDNTTQARLMTNQADLSSPDDQFASSEELAQINAAQNPGPQFPYKQSNPNTPEFLQPLQFNTPPSSQGSSIRSMGIDELGQKYGHPMSEVPSFLKAFPVPEKPGMSVATPESFNPELNGINTPASPTAVPTKAPPVSPKPVPVELGQQPPMPDPQSIGSLENLLAAQNAANNVRSVNQGSQGLDLISAGMAGLGSNSIVKPSGQALFKQQGEAGDKITANYKDAVAMEKHDPNSPVSKAIQKYAKKLGFDPKGLSAADMEKVMPYVSKAFDAQENRKARKDELGLRLSEMNQRFALARDQKKTDNEERAKISDLKTAHGRLDKVGNKIIPGLASARSAFGRMAGTIRSAEALKKLVADQPLNSIDSRQVYELARGLDSMLSQSQGTIAGTDHLIPRTLQGDIAKIKEYGSNGPVGLNQQKFVKKTMKLLEREFQLAEEQMKKVQKQQLAPLRDLFEHKNPEINQAARDIINIHGIDNPFEEKNGLQKDFESEGD